MLPSQLTTPSRIKRARALRHAAPYVRKQLSLSLNLPRSPEIHFVRDRIEEKGERVDRLLEKIEQEWKEGTDENEG